MIPTVPQPDGQLVDWPTFAQLAYAWTQDLLSRGTITRAQDGVRTTMIAGAVRRLINLGAIDMTGLVKAQVRGQVYWRQRSQMHPSVVRRVQADIYDAWFSINV